MVFWEVKQHDWGYSPWPQEVFSFLAQHINDVCALYRQEQKYGKVREEVQVLLLEMMTSNEREQTTVIYVWGSLSGNK